MNNNTEMLVYDLNTNTQIGSIEVPVITDHHNNNINFGYEFYAEGDEFPLLYLSQENNDVHKCVVARITRSRNKWTYTPVQTITFPTPQENGFWWANSYIDPENKCMYLMGYKNQTWTDGSNENRLVSRRWELPKLIDGDVTLRVEDSSNYHEMPFWTATQGAIFKDGKLYQVYGTLSYKEWIKLRVLDLYNGVVEEVFELYDQGLKQEPEGIGYYNGLLYVIDVQGVIWKIEMVEVPKKDTYEPLPGLEVLPLTEDELNEALAESTVFGATQSSQGNLNGYYNGKRLKIYINNANQFDPKGLVITEAVPAGMKYGVTLFNTNVATIADMNADGGIYDSGNVYGGWSTAETTHDFTPYEGKWVRYQTTVAKTNGTDTFTEEEFNAVIAWWKRAARFKTEAPQVNA